MSHSSQALLTTDTLTELYADIMAVAGDRTFTLPEADAHVVGISSGNDSSSVALIMGALFPNLENLHYVFTDTGVEVDGTEQQIAKIEEITGRKVLRLSAGVDLFTLIEGYGNFLPSQRSRYCTVSSKIKPLLAYFDTLAQEKGEGTRIASYVGIRADEPQRRGGEYGDGGAVSHFPLQALGFTRKDVYALVDKWLGLPTYYANKSRSGCSICIFSRRSEVLAQLDTPTETVARAINMEGLSEQATAKLTAYPASVCDQVGVARNHLTYAIPASLVPEEGPHREAVMPWESLRATIDDSDNGDLFGNSLQGAKRFFVAVEMHIGDMGQGAECYYQKYITHSTSLGGIKKALKFHWQHKVDTRELLGHDSEAHLRDALRIAIFEVALEDADEHLLIDKEDAYTWQNDGQPLLLLRKTKYLLEQILLTEGLTQGLKDGREWVREEAQAWLPRVTQTYGKVLWSQLYDAPTTEDLALDFDIEDQPVACNICSR